MSAIRTYYTADEFFKIAQSLGQYELVEGEIKRMPPTSGRHGKVTVKITTPLSVYVDEHDLGEVFAAETGYILKHAQKDGERDTVRGIDVSFVRKERILPDEDVLEKFIPFPPDLAVEVVSPGNPRREIDEKVGEYLDAGVPLIWVIFPRTKTVTVYRQNGEVETKRGNDVLSGEDVVPGFTLKVDRIFA